MRLLSFDPLNKHNLNIPVISCCMHLLCFITVSRLPISQSDALSILSCIIKSLRHDIWVRYVSWHNLNTVDLIWVRFQIVSFRDAFEMLLTLYPQRVPVGAQRHNFVNIWKISMNFATKIVFWRSAHWSHKIVTTLLSQVFTFILGCKWNARLVSHEAMHAQVCRLFFVVYIPLFSLVHLGYAAI